MIGYVLLIITWLFVLSYMVYPWIKFGSDPAPWLWVILIALAIVSFANRLKIGNWFDFSRKVKNLKEDISSIKSDIVKINNRMDLSNVQNQQQINVSLASEEAAKAFASRFAQRPRLQTKAANFMKVGRKGYCVVEGMDPADVKRFNFLQAVENMINSVEPLIYILYALTIAKREKKSPEAKSVFSKPLPEVIHELQDENAGLVKIIPNDVAAKLKHILQTITNLYTLWEDIIEMNTELPDESKRTEILREADQATGYLSGLITAFAELFITADAIFRNGEFIVYRPREDRQAT